jgi:hypothetical protein
VEAKLAADDPRTPLERRIAGLGRVLFGRPLASEEELSERLPKWKVLPVFTSDVMSIRTGSAPTPLRWSTDSERPRAERTLGPLRTAG